MSWDQEDSFRTPAATRLDFTNARALVVVGDEHSGKVIVQILKGFEVREIHKAGSGEEAKQLLAQYAFGFVLCDSDLPDMSGPDLVRWARHHKDPDICFVSFIVFTDFAKYSKVVAARDCGANVVVRRPFTPQVLFDRIAWIAQTNRGFVDSESYKGPDRRFKNSGPPDGEFKRSTDRVDALGDATEPNLSQSEVNSLMRPTKVSL